MDLIAFCLIFDFTINSLTLSSLQIFPGSKNVVCIVAYECIQ